MPLPGTGGQLFPLGSPDAVTGPTASATRASRGLQAALVPVESLQERWNTSSIGHTRSDLRLCVNYNGGKPMNFKSVRLGGLPLWLALGALSLIAVIVAPSVTQAADGPVRGLNKIGIVGAGRMGGTLAGLWSKAGYHVMLSSRHPEQLDSLAKSIGPNVSVGTPEQAASYGNVVVIRVPYGAEPQLGKQLASQLDHKVVVDV